jgi:hypothetical protein
MTEPQMIERAGKRTAAEVLADWRAIVAPPFLDESTPQALRSYDLAFAGYCDRVADLLVEAARLPASERPEAIVRWAFNKAISTARKNARTYREWHADEFDDDQPAEEATS